jgi:hypothetical protein
LDGEEDSTSRLDDEPKEFVAAVGGREEVLIVEGLEETQSMEPKDSRTGWLERRTLSAG